MMSLSLGILDIDNLDFLLAPFSDICVPYIQILNFIFFNESCSFKIMKNVIYFILKAFFVLKICKSLSWFFDHVEKRLGRKTRKIRLISKFLTLQPS